MVKKKKVKKKTSKQKHNAKLKKILILVALVIFNLIIAIDLALGLIAIIIGLFVTGIALTLAGITTTLFSLIYPFFPESWVVQNMSSGGVSSWAGVFLGISLTCIGTLITIGMSYVTKYVYKGLVWYIKLNIAVFKEYGN
jgi:uncharacterized membrane protein